MALRTPLYDRHVALGARIVDFGGYAMPLQYTGIRDEHLAVRGRAGLFDVSHMGEVLITGAGAADAVQRLVTNDVARLAEGGCLYSVMCNQRGGIVDDVIVMRRPADQGYMVVVNAARRSADLAFMREHVGATATVTDIGDECGLLAVQGPAALGVVGALVDADLAALAPFSSAELGLRPLTGGAATVSRTGYTGEDGVEIYVDAARVGALWDLLLERGADDGLVPAGLGARDTLRLEAGLRLYGQDMDEDVDPYSAGLGWTVKPAAGDFVGRDALREIKERGAPLATIGLALEGRAIARHGHEVLRCGAAVGRVTSGTYGFTVGRGVATALVETARAREPLYEVDIRGAVTTAQAVRLPFYRRPSD